jgi:hypothetical protein
MSKMKSRTFETLESPKNLGFEPPNELFYPDFRRHRSPNLYRIVSHGRALVSLQAVSVSTVTQRVGNGKILKFPSQSY